MNTTCWNCKGKGHKADDCPYKKATTPNQNQNCAEENGQLQEMANLTIKQITWNVSSTTLPRIEISNIKKLWF